MIGRILILTTTLSVVASAGLAQGRPSSGQPAGSPTATASAPSPTGTPKATDRKTQIVQEITNAGVSAAGANVANPMGLSFGPGGREEIVSYIVASLSTPPSYGALLDAMENARTDKQVGATAANANSTSLVSKGTVPDILGLAVEKGVLAQDVNGSVLTFRVTPAGLVKALQGEDLVTELDEITRSKAWSVASNASAAVSFDTSLGSTPGTFTADQKQLTSCSVRYELINTRRPDDAGYSQLWTGILTTEGNYAAADTALDDTLTSWPDYVKWETGAAKALEAGAPVAARCAEEARSAAHATTVPPALPPLAYIAACNDHQTLDDAVAHR